MNLSLRLANHIVTTEYDDLPRHVVNVTKNSLLDGLGVILAASGLGEGCRPFVDLALKERGKKESTIIGFDVKVSACMAAFANGSMAHAIDFEDAHDGAEVHPNAATIPAALALAESIGNVNGKELIAALALGSDIVCRLGLARDREDDPLKAGWYIPPILGAFGATAASCKLLRLGPKQIVDAFSLTLCQATCSAEIIHSPRSVIRGVRDAFQAKAGVLSASLAKEGVTGFDQPFEGKAGFFTMYSKGRYDSSKLTKGLGKVFEGAQISFKPWPACRGTHSFIEATLKMAEEHEIRPGDIKTIQLIISPSSADKMLCEPIERKRNPTTAIDAKFSIPYTVATALMYTEVSLDHFTSQALQNPDVLELTRKITYAVDPALEPHQGFIRMKTERDELTARTAALVYGHPENPIRPEALVAKFMDCASHALKKITKKELNKAVRLISHMEDLNNIDELMKCL
jgi:2-methylcitrate dehydratase PrpD